MNNCPTGVLRRWRTPAWLCTKAASQKATVSLLLSGAKGWSCCSWKSAGELPPFHLMPALLPCHLAMTPLR